MYLNMHIEEISDYLKYKSLWSLERVVTLREVLLNFLTTFPLSQATVKY